LQHSATRDVPYAYLQMDERDHHLTHASLAARGHKLYLNRADHLMDNGLRTSVASMRMATDADQTTVGASGRLGPLGYEGFFREWDARNVIAAAMGSVDNHLLPDVRQWAANLSGTRRLGPVLGSLRAGWTRLAVGDRAALAHHRILTPGAPDERTFVPFAASASAVGRERRGWTPGIALEAASEPPSHEQLWITVRRPGMPATRRPDWVGRPDLDAVTRLTARASARHALGFIEGHVSRLADYVLPVAATSGPLRLQTYRGVDALIAALTLHATAGPLEARGSWSSGQNLTDDGPLPEMAPLAGSLVLKSPRLRGVTGSVTLSGAARARRIDASLGETPTAAWACLDLGARWQGSSGLMAEVAVENLTDALQTQHLSYLRDPFAAGLRVWEPGRRVRLMVSMDH
jgi:iron complex outermembrane receptor protein